MSELEGMNFVPKWMAWDGSGVCESEDGMNTAVVFLAWLVWVGQYKYITVGYSTAQYNINALHFDTIGHTQYKRCRKYEG